MLLLFVPSCIMGSNAFIHFKLNYNGDLGLCTSWCTTTRIMGTSPALIKSVTSPKDFVLGWHDILSEILFSS